MKEFQPKDLSEICKINKSTLQRYLDDREMIPPLRVDESTGYRYYSESAVDKINIFKLLQKKPYRLNKNEIKPILISADFDTILEYSQQSEQSLHVYLLEKGYL